MRIDKFLKVSRILKRRAVASEACSSNKVAVNGRAVKPAHRLSVGDEVVISFAGGDLRFRVKALNEKINSKDADTLYEIIDAAQRT